jgi:GNAT superfamily N-acetyltransferase
MSRPVRPYDPFVDERWASEFLDTNLGGRWQARRGEIIDVLATGLGLVVEPGAGLLTYRIDIADLELTAIAARPSGQGTGTALIEALVAVARDLDVARIWVVTTNDNIDALAFYERRGFRRNEVRARAVDEARTTLKPTIPLIGQHGIEMHDEIDLVMDLPRG